MTFVPSNWITASLLAAAVWLGVNSTGDATCFGRRTAYRVPSPCATCGMTPTATNSVPVTNYSLPVTTNYPPPSHRCDCQPNAPLAMATGARPLFSGWSVPRASYRTVWAQVPVTYYRPVAGTVPTVNSLQPCSRCAYQARRVPNNVLTTRVTPLTTYPPISAAYSGVAPIATGWTASSNSVTYTYPATTGTEMVNSWPGYATSQVFSPNCSATVPNTSCSNCDTGASSAPTGPANNVTYETPATGYGTSAPTQPADKTISEGSQLHPVPADGRPRLEATPQTDNGVPIYHPPSTERGKSSTLDLDDGTGKTSYQPPLLDREIVSPPGGYPSNQSLILRGTNSVRPDPVQRATSQPSRRPIPDPNRKLPPWSEDRAPSLLLDTGDRTALSQETKWYAVPIAWQQEEDARNPNIQRAGDSFSDPNSHWDDSGWLPSSR